MYALRKVNMHKYVENLPSQQGGWIDSPMQAVYDIYKVGCHCF